MVRIEVIRNTLVYRNMGVDRTIVYEVLQAGSVASKNYSASLHVSCSDFLP